MKLLDDKTSKALIKIIPVLLILALAAQFAIVSASNNTNSSELNISLNETNVSIIINISENNETNINNSEPVNETNTAKKKIKGVINIKNSKDISLRAVIDIIDKNGLIKRLESSDAGLSALSNDEYEYQIDEGVYDVELTPADHPVKKIKFKDVSLTQDTIELGLDDVPEEDITEKNFVEAYAIDPTNLNFTEAEVTVTATGTELYKCKDWNFEEQACYGDWELFKTGLVPGEEYTFILTPDDPGFGEINATDAEHLDENYTFISNIYDDIKALDDVWSEPIYENEFVRVSYESNLTNGSVIDIYVRNLNSTNTWFEIYNVNSAYPLLGISKIFNSTGEWDYITLSNVSSPADTFDFKIIGEEDSYLEFDYIHDAANGNLNDDSLTCVAATLALGEKTNCTGQYDETANKEEDWTLWLEDDTVAITRTCGANDFKVTDVDFTTSNTVCDSEADGVVSCDAWGQSVVNQQIRWEIEACAADADNTIITNAASTTSGTDTLTVTDTIVTTSDTIPPNISLVSPANDSWQDNRNINFTFSATTNDDFANCSLWTNETSWSLKQTNKSTVSNNTLHGINDTFGSDGNFLWNIECFDTNGNSNFSVSNYTVNIDTTAPTISLGNPVNNSWTNSTNVTFYFTPDDVKDIANCTLVINDALNQTNRTAITKASENSIWTILEEGTYNWTVNCTDTAATPNTGTNTSVKIINVDITAPNITLTAPADNNVTIDDYMVFNFTATDNMATLLNCSIYLNNTLNQTNSSTSNGTAAIFNITGIPDGDHSWNISCMDNATNVNWSSTRIFEINRSPDIVSVNDTTDPIKGGELIAIEPSGIADPNSDNLRYYCSENSAPTSSNTNCSQGNTVYSSPYSTINCTFNTPSDSANHIMYCRVYDGTYYSNTVSTNYTTDSTPPTLLSTVTIIPNVTDVTTAQTATLPNTFYDRYDDGYINITVTGESGMSCRYYTTDTAYNAGAGTACLTNGINATCQPIVDTQGSDAHNFHVSCADNLSNGQNTSQNIDITSLVTDWTAPTTTDNSNTNVQLPTYTVTITEADNIDGDPTTYYCIDTNGSCTPTTEYTVPLEFTTSNRGRNYLRYYSTDDAGNNQTTANQTININQLPAFNESWDDAATIKGGAKIIITTNSSDADSQTLKLYVCNSTNVNYSGCVDTTYCSNTTETANSTCNFTAETDDTTHTWYAYIYDSLNESAVNNYSDSYITDSTAPTITINSPVSDTYSQNWVSASITLNEAGSWVGYSLNGAANISLTNSSPTIWAKQIEGLADGGYNLTFYANDSVGNIENKTINFTIDATAPDTLAPAITIIEPGSGSSYKTNSVYLNISINENASWAAYSLDNAANVTMTNASPTDWYYNITSITDAVHQIMFYANDTSNNTGNSSTISFTKDSNAPQYIINNNTPLAPNDNQNVTCYSHWTDTLGLSHAIIEENATGSFVNHTVSLSGTDDWGNYTIAAVNLTPGTVQCRAYANDTLGNLNQTSAWTFTVNDVTPPSMNISYTPSSEDDLDPGVLINVSANVSDNVAVSNVTLQYKNSTEAGWNNYSMTKVSSTYYGNFTPTNADNYTFRVWANDSSGNINTSSNITVDVQKDTTWTLNPSEFSTVSALITENATLGTMLINVTGDYDLEFDLNNSPASISVYYNDTEPFSLSSKASKNISITATALSTEASTTVSIKVNATNASASPDFTYVNGTFISYTDGAYLYVTITKPTSTDTITQGDTINISAQVNNMGSQDATGVWLKWGLPSDWANNSGLNRSIGFLGVGETATHAMTATVNSTAATGTVTLNVSSGSSEGKNGSATVSVTVSSAEAEEEAEEAAAADGGGGGGGGGGSGVGGGGGISKTIYGKELFETEESFELIRGLTESFPIKITNIYEEETLYDVDIKVEGYLAQYLLISPSKIQQILPGQTKEFTVTIDSATYMKQGTYPLEFTITGRLEGVKITKLPNNVTIKSYTRKDLIEKRLITLFIHEVSKEDTITNINDAKKNIEDMINAGLPVSKAARLMEEVNDALREKDYKKVKELSEQIATIRKNAFIASELIAEVKNKIRQSEEKGINVDEAKNMLNLAMAAFEREDFETAIKRAKDAQLTELLTSKGKINVLKFIQKYWWAVLMSIIVLSVSGVIADKKLAIILIKRRIEDLDKEEVTINNLMGELQEQTFKKKEVSIASYHKQMYNYEARLSEIRQLRDRLRTKEARVVKISEEIAMLNKKDNEIIDKIKQLQNAYYNKRTINKRNYAKRMEEYRVRRSEVERTIALLETKLAKKEAVDQIKEMSKKVDDKKEAVIKKIKPSSKQPQIKQLEKKEPAQIERTKKELTGKNYEKAEEKQEMPTVNDLVMQTKRFAKAENKKAIISSLKKEHNLDEFKFKESFKEPEGDGEERKRENPDLTKPTEENQKTAFDPKKLKAALVYKDDISALESHGFKVKRPASFKSKILKQQTAPLMKEIEPKHKIPTAKFTAKTKILSKHSIINNLKEVYEK